VDERIFWVGLNLVKGIGAARFETLMAHFGSPRAAWEAPAQQLNTIGLPAPVLEALLEVRRTVDLEQIWDQIQARGITLITLEDEGYPARLRKIDQPPPVLYALGELTQQDEWAVAIVGTRRTTHYGRQVAEEAAAFLAQNGVTVVSGLARGVDSIAHRAALDAGGRTIAVLGSGVDQIYPAENRGLAAEMLQHGAVISDYALGTPPEAGNFPPRNRIIAGMSIAVVVVEAGERSGASITASFALEQGREVFAVPGSIYSPQSKGTNRLIRDGAHPLLAPEDLLEVLNLSMVTEHQKARVVLPANAVEAAIFEALGHEPVHVDQIGQQAKLPIEQISATLTLMELKGMVRQVGGMRYVAVREAQAAYNLTERKDES
jgi:DNA processing protein